jgi:hypothetical protein
MRGRWIFGSYCRRGRALVFTIRRLNAWVSSVNISHLLVRKGIAPYPARVRWCWHCSSNVADLCWTTGLPKGSTINADSYGETLERLRAVILCNSHSWEAATFRMGSSSTSPLQSRLVSCDFNVFVAGKLASSLKLASHSAQQCLNWRQLTESKRLTSRI